MPRKLYTWKLKNREIRLGERTLIVGVLNVTPDSFSDGGLYDDPARALVRAIELEEQGADIIDIGAESTKPGSVRISAAEEIRRLIPVLKKLKGELRIPISVDTYKAEVAELAIEHGAEIINDPSGFTWDPLLAKVVVQNDAGLILNHMRGTPETWAKLGPIPDVMLAITRDLDASVSRARRAGVERHSIVLDPGIGFGKRKEQNAEIIARLAALAKLEYPILVGPSRKAFLAQSTEEETAFSTAAAVTAAVLSGAHMVRVHDVAEMRAALSVADEVLRATPDAAAPEAPATAPARRAHSPEAPATAPPRPVRPKLKLLREVEPAPPPPPSVVEEFNQDDFEDLTLEDDVVEAVEEVEAAPEVPKPRPVERAAPAPRKFAPRDSKPTDGSRPLRKFPPRSGPPGDRETRPPRKFDGPPRRDGPPARKFGPPRKDGPPGFGPKRSGPPRPGGGGPRKFGPPRKDGPPGFGPKRSGPPRPGGGGPRKFGPPRKDGPPRGGPPRRPK